MFAVVFYVPETHLEKVKQAVFKVGAGYYHAYDCCAFQMKGQGQFRPLEGSKPFIGKTNQVETVEEYRVEVICEDKNIKAVISALKTAHPYEEPAYHYWQVNTV